MSSHETILIKLAEQYAGKNCSKIERITQSGSNRLYFRLFFEERVPIIGVFNADLKENLAYFTLTQHFLSRKINVPKVLAVDDSNQYYLLYDLGDETLYSFLTSHRVEDGLPDSVLQYYRKVIQQLPLIQLAGKSGLDFSVCYPRYAFDRQSMQWDLNYFKYYFLKLAGISFDEQLLEDDFNILIDFLLEADSNYFLYRDFQSRNIMIHQDEVFFIDFQGGRKGALQYDIASLLYDGKADIPPKDREQLLHYYLDELEKVTGFDRKEFLIRYDAFVLIRILQALGTYGFRGYYEKKSHFLLSIPYAVRNIRYLLKTMDLPVKIPVLLNLLKKITESSDLPKLPQKDNKLTVSINSFSYKKEIPRDLTANGGGFVFDCRALPNPGREKEYANLSGKDEKTIAYMESFEQTKIFREHAFAIIDASVDNYMERKFNHLMVNFGCTGGQHRSVFFAESLSKHLKEKYPDINVLLRHTNL